MNEKQRRQQAQIKQVDKPLSEKTSADFAKYFETTYEPPNINKARKRYREKVEVHYDFSIPDDMKNIGKGKKFLIRTYGCQMNEHDTEVMAGILRGMGYEATTDTDEADNILYTGRASRENAENKRFGEIGDLNPLRLENPDLILGLCGWMSQQESVVKRILKRHQHPDLIFGTHN